MQARRRASLRSRFRTLLERVFNKHRINDSWAYTTYLRLAYPDAARAKKAELAFYKGLLGPQGAGLVFDIGANHGGKAAVFVEMARKVVCVEADPAAVEVLRQRFCKNRRVAIVGTAAGGRQGVLRLHRFDDGGPYNTLSDKWVSELASAPGSATARPRLVEASSVDVKVTTLDDLIRQHGKPDYIKIDVEGHELEVVRGLSSAASIISIECNLPVFTSETLSIITMLKAAASGGAFNFTDTEPPTRFTSNVWLTAGEIAEIVSSGGFKFMEIYFDPRRVGGEVSR